MHNMLRELIHSLQRHAETSKDPVNPLPTPHYISVIVYLLLFGMKRCTDKILGPTQLDIELPLQLAQKSLVRDSPPRLEISNLPVIVSGCSTIDSIR